MSSKAELYERLLIEKERQVDILAEQLMWLRAHKGMPTVQTSAPVEFHGMEIPRHMSEEEEDIREMAKRQILSEGEAQEALARVFDLATFAD